MKVKCEKCSERATIHITEIDDDNSYQEVHFCAKCAQDYLTGQMDKPTAVMSESKPPMVVRDPGEKIDQKQCPMCKTTFAEFRASGRLGCAHDYEVFREELLPLLENIHDASRHIGKVPRRAPLSLQSHTKRTTLRQELQQAIAVEDYERAAQLRDEIEGLDRKPGS